MKKIIGAFMPFLLSALLISCGTNKEKPFGSGLIEADEVTISAETSGRIERLYIDEGQVVSRGDTVALIDTIMISLRLAQTGALRDGALARLAASHITVEQTANDYDLAKKEFDRTSRLLASGTANQRQFDQAESGFSRAELARRTAQVAVQTANAELARVEAELSLLAEQYRNCRPVAPSGGTVTTTYLDEGELVGAGQALAQVVRLDTVWVKIYLPPADLTKFKLGAEAKIDPEDGAGSLLTGRVSWISDKAEFTPKNVQTKEARADLVYAVKIQIPNPEQKLKIGMPVSVMIP